MRSLELNISKLIRRKVQWTWTSSCCFLYVISIVFSFFFHSAAAQGMSLWICVAFPVLQEQWRHRSVGEEHVYLFHCGLQSSQWGRTQTPTSDAVIMLVDLNILHNLKFKRKLSVITSYTYRYEKSKNLCLRYWNFSKTSFKDTIWVIIELNLKSLCDCWHSSQCSWLGQPESRSESHVFESGARW